MLNRKVFLLLASFGFLLFLSLGFVSSCDECEIEIVAHKIVCDSEVYLPNWGGVQGVPSINENTAQEFVDENSKHCHFEEGWEFQWTLNLGDPNNHLDNPGDHLEYAPNWTTFGPTNSNGKATATIPDAKDGRVEIREVFQEGYFPFSGYPPYNESLDENVSAEFYCDGDVFHYDNYEYIIDPNDNDTFYCVAFNALIELDLDPPTCSVDYLKGVYGEGTYDFSESIYINNIGRYEVYGFSSANDPDCQMDVVQYNRTSPDPYFVPSWKSSSKQTSNWSLWKTDVNDISFTEGLHEICCLPTSQECEDGKCGSYIIGNSSCQQFCIDATAPEKITNVAFSNKPQEICGNESVINYAPIFSWDSLEDEGCAPIHYELKLFFSNGTLIETYNLGENTIFEVPSEYLFNGEDYYVEVRAVDEAGNEGEWSDASEHVWYDIEDPKVELKGELLPKQGTWFNTNFEVEENDTDNLGLYLCEYMIKNNNVLVKDWTNITCNENVTIHVPEECGEETCTIYKRVTDLACNVGENSEGYKIDLTPPITYKNVGDPKVESFGDWVTKLINGWFVNDKTYINLYCEDNLSGCNETYYTIDFQPFYENGTYGDWINVFTNKAYDNKSFALEQGDGLYNITYWSVDNAGNVENAQFEIDKVDLYAPKTSKLFTGLIVQSLNYESENFDFPVVMDFILPSYDGEPIINLTATDSEVGVDKTWYQILVPSDETTNHVEAYLNGKWNEENSEEFMECVVDAGCATTSLNLDEDDFLQNKEPQPEFDFEMINLEDSLSWKVDFRDSGITSSGLQLMFNDGVDIFQIAVNNDYPNGMIQMYPWGSNSPSTTLPSGVIVNGAYGDSQIEIIVPLSMLNEGNYDYAINAEVDWDASAGSIQNHYPETWQRWTTNGMASSIDYSQCEEECNLTYWELSPQFKGMHEDGCNEGWCEYNNETGIVFTEECDHKVCYYSEDRLGNEEEVQCTVFSIDGEGPLLALHNPDTVEALSVEGCSLDILVEAIDEKVGIDEISGIYATLKYSNGTVIGVYDLKKYRSTGGSVYNGAGYEAVITLDGLEAGEYELRITSLDILGNTRNYTRTITLKEGIFVDKSWSPSCSVGEEGGLCELEFRTCVRGATEMDFYMGKINGDLVSPLAINGLLLIGNDSGLIGLMPNADNQSWSGEIVPLDSCEVVNGWSNFVVSLNFTPEIVETIGSGNYGFDYEINSYLYESCSQSFS